MASRTGTRYRYASFRSAGLRMKATATARIVAATLAALVLTGCGGLLKSPADGLTFHAPNGWVGSPGINGTLQMWLGNFGPASQALTLVKIDGRTRPEDFDTKVLLNIGSGALPTALKIVERRSLTLCHDQRSIYVKMRGRARLEQFERVLEMVVSSAPRSTYVAYYSCPSNWKPNDQAEAALYELCPA